MSWDAAEGVGSDRLANVSAARGGLAGHAIHPREGKIHGVARAAKKSRRRFGGALEPLTHVLARYEDRERRELSRLDSCEVLESPLADEVGYSELSL